jgi:peptidoglycan/xylan/chitin deacetylase (PgdA/CDA1 family)
MSIAILMYHQVGEVAPRGTPHRGLAVSPAAFLRQMTWMRRLGYRGLAMRDLMPYLQGERHGKVFGLTFDDAFQNVYRNALPILNTLNFTATSYFVAHQLNGSNVWDHTSGVPPAPLMSLHEMRAWAEVGNEVGSHTLDHVDLSRLPRDEARHQIEHSKTELEQALGNTITAFCYPYGRYLPEHALMARAAGYQNTTTTLRGHVKPYDNLFELPRVSISHSTHLLHFFRKCLMRYENSRQRQ